LSGGEVCCSKRERLFHHEGHQEHEGRSFDHPNPSRISCIRGAYFVTIPPSVLSFVQTGPAPRRALQRFYPWVVIAIAFLTVAMAFGARNAFAVFLIAVIDEFRRSRGLASAR